VGKISVIFTRTNISYELTVDDLRAAAKFALLDGQDRSHNIYSPLPKAPKLVQAHADKLDLAWDSPQPPGKLDNSTAHIIDFNHTHYEL
jgi:hypothetical protein